MFRWILERDTQRTLLEAKALGNGEARLRCLFIMGINALPYMKKGMESNYRDELERMLAQYLQRLFEQVCDAEGLYQTCTRAEEKLILRYHSQAILGILRNWTAEDTKNLDQIVHVAFRLMTEGISPVGRSIKGISLQPCGQMKLTESPRCKKALHLGFFVYTYAHL